MPSRRDLSRPTGRFCQPDPSAIRPNPMMVVNTIFDTNPQTVTARIGRGKQALLAKVRYNRLIDVFLRVRAFSVQHHLHPAAPNRGQSEADEVYVAVRDTGKPFVVPVRAKGENERISTKQVRQDLAMCREKFPNLTPKSVAVQFTRDDLGEVIAMFELAEGETGIGVVGEKHYRLVPAGQITADDLARFAESPD